MTTEKLLSPNRADILRDRVQSLVRELGPGAKLPKVVDLCRDWQVSPTTLNRIMSDLEGDGWLHRRHAVGVFVADDVPMSHLLSSVGIICRPSFLRGAGHSPFWDLLLQTSQQHADRHGVSCDLYFSREMDEQGRAPLPDAVRLAFENRKIGAVLGIGLDAVTAMWLMERRVPVVNLFGKGHFIVGFDTGIFMRLAVQSLVEAGCRDVALWVNAPVSGTLADVEFRQQELTELFEAQLNANALEFSPSHVYRSPHKSAPSPMEQGFAFAQQTFSADRSQWPAGIVSVDDMVTHGALVAMRKLGVEVGKDVQIATHSNADSPILMGETALKRVEYAPSEIVATMWKQLERLLLTRDWPEDRHVRVAPHLA